MQGNYSYKKTGVRDPSNHTSAYNHRLIQTICISGPLENRNSGSESIQVKTESESDTDSDTDEKQDRI
jgi:hypothetical protein